MTTATATVYIKEIGARHNYEGYIELKASTRFTFEFFVKIPEKELYEFIKRAKSLKERKDIVDEKISLKITDENNKPLILFSRNEQLLCFYIILSAYKLLADEIKECRRNEKIFCIALPW